MPAQSRIFFECQPIFPVMPGWQLGLAVTIGLAILCFVIWQSIRDSKRLSRATTALFLLLRLSALLVMLIYVLNPGQRSETKLVKTSRLPVLIDTSLSMGLTDEFSKESLGSVPRRIDQVTQWLKTQTTLGDLQFEHEIPVYQFGESTQPELVTVMAKIKSESNSNTADPSSSAIQNLINRSKTMALFAIALLGIGLVCLIAWALCFSANKIQTGRAFIYSGGISSLLMGVVVLGLADLNTPDFPLSISTGWKSAGSFRSTLQPTETANLEQPAGKIDPSSFEKLTPRGTSTKIGDALQFIVNQERGGPIAGLVLITDGQQNAGLPITRAIASSSNAGISIFPIGVGSKEIPKNVKVVDIQAPPRVFPADRFQIKGLLKSFGMANKTLAVQLVSIDEAGEEAETLEAETTVRLPADGENVSVEFGITQKEEGQRRYIIRCASVPGELDSRDNEKAAEVEIVDRQTKVLLMAGGPMREFRFLRNQLYRDKDMMLHVWLQSARQGADQEADVLLHEFPTTRDELFEFDCIIAFDPDWRALSEEQSDLLERWVAEQAGGLVVVAGPVNTPEWTRRPRGDETIDNIRRLYPVSFFSQGSAQLRLGRFGGTEPFPLGFTREGRAAEFLWIGDTASVSQSTWKTFEGVFGYYAVNESKAGADVLANFSDPSTSIDKQLPIYLASQYYGSGRVFFQASGEMWRVRRLDVEYFQQYYVKLIRWASQGRLLRNSQRGVLLTDRERCWMGDQVAVQSMLRNLQDEPLLVPEVNSIVKRPDGTTQSLVLRSAENAVRPGTYRGSLTATMEGEYRISLTIPDGNDAEILSTTVNASIPDLEIAKPQRNDELLTEMAESTYGHFYVGLDNFSVRKTDALSPLNLIQPQDQVTFLTGSLNMNFQRKLMMWLMGVLTFALCCEWIVRRLNRLA